MSIAPNLHTQSVASPEVIEDLFRDRRDNTNMTTEVVGRMATSIASISAGQTSDETPKGQLPEFKRAPIEPGEFMSVGQAWNILNYRSFRQKGGASEDMPLCNEDLVGYGFDLDTAFWPSREAHKKALRGFTDFMSVFTADAVAKLGVTSSAIARRPDFHNFGTTDGAFEILLGDNYKETFGDTFDFDNTALPQVQYQGITQRVKPIDRYGNPKRWAGFKKFLHFSTKGEVEPISPDFDEAVRLYLNPTPEATAAVAAEICQGFISLYGYIPHGKFMEDATSQTIEQRDDRLLFYLHSPDQLTTILQLTHDIQKQRPELFAGRQAILTGEPVVINGQELATARLAQEVPQSKTSFNDFMTGVLKTGIFQAFGESYVNNPTEQDAHKFIAKLRELAARFGRNPKSIAFNEGQDMSVIYSAIARVQ